jgi:hypothetical protein
MPRMKLRYRVPTATTMPQFFRRYAKSSSRYDSTVACRPARCLTVSAKK